MSLLVGAGRAHPRWGAGCWHSSLSLFPSWDGEYSLQAVGGGGLAGGSEIEEPTVDCGAEGLVASPNAGASAAGAATAWVPAVAATADCAVAGSCAAAESPAAQRGGGGSCSTAKGGRVKWITAPVVLFTDRRDAAGAAVTIICAGATKEEGRASGGCSPTGCGQYICAGSIADDKEADRAIRPAAALADDGRSSTLTCGAGGQSAAGAAAPAGCERAGPWPSAERGEWGWQAGPSGLWSKGSLVRRGEAG